MVKKAIIPASGLGSRVGNLTRVIPKEILPLGRETAIERLVKELKDAGIKEILIVTTSHKIPFFKEIDKLNNWNFSYLIQDKPDGFAGAIKAGESWVAKEPFIIALPDDFLLGINSTKQLLESYKEGYLLATVEVEAEEVKNYGIVERGAKQEVIHLVEKPEPFTTLSREAIFGRYILQPEIFKKLEASSGVANGGLTEALESAIQEGVAVNALNFKEIRMDIGSYEGWLRGNNLIEAGESFKK